MASSVTSKGNCDIMRWREAKTDLAMFRMQVGFSPETGPRALEKTGLC